MLKTNKQHRSSPQQRLDKSTLMLSKHSRITRSYRKNLAPAIPGILASGSVYQSQRWKQHRSQKTYPRRRTEKTLIPDTLLTRLIIHNHLARNHPGRQEEIQFLREFSYQRQFSKVQAAVDEYRARCLHCARVPKLIRREQNLTPISRTPREIIHADYLYINVHSHYLVLVDNATRKIFLKHTTRDDAETMALAVLEFLGNFQLLDTFQIYTDNGSYFAGSLMEHLSKQLKFTRNFSIQYAPWSNGTVESANDKLLRKIKTLCSEFRLHEKEIYKLTGLLMHIMNNSPCVSKNNYTPNELFMCAPPDTSTALISQDTVFIVNKGQVIKPTTHKTVVETTKELQEHMLRRLNEAYDATLRNRRRQNALYNERYKCAQLQFVPGEFVLVSKANTHALRDKTKPTWVGPYQVLRQTHRNVYVVQDLLQVTQVVHSSRLWPYAPPDYVPNEAMRNLFIHDKGALEVEKFLQVTFKKGRYFLLTKWLGFDDSYNTLEPLTTMNEDLPGLTREFLHKDKTSTAKRALQSLNRQSKKITANAIEHHRSLQIQGTSMPTPVRPYVLPYMLGVKIDPFIVQTCLPTTPTRYWERRCLLRWYSTIQPKFERKTSHHTDTTLYGTPTQLVYRTRTIDTAPIQTELLTSCKNLDLAFSSDWSTPATSISVAAFTLQPMGQNLFQNEGRTIRILPPKSCYIEANASEPGLLKWLRNRLETNFSFINLRLKDLFPDLTEIQEQGLVCVWTTTTLLPYAKRHLRKQGYKVLQFLPTTQASSYAHGVLAARGDNHTQLTPLRLYTVTEDTVGYEVFELAEHLSTGPYLDLHSNLSCCRQHWLTVGLEYETSLEKGNDTPPIGSRCNSQLVQHAGDTVLT